MQRVSKFTSTDSYQTHLGMKMIQQFVPVVAAVKNQASSRLLQLDLYQS